MFSASWNVPMFVAPSPKNASATRGSPRSWNASAAPVICGSPPPIDGVRAEVAALDVVEVHRAAVSVRAALLLAVQLGHQLVRVRALRERVPVRAVGRRDHVAVLERAAHADGARLLADRDVEEAGQLARAEALLHLLLEAADEQHLAQDVGQLVLRAASPSSLRPLPRRAVYGCSRWHSSTSGTRSSSGLDPRWSDAHVVLTLADAALAGRAAALLAPAGPGNTDAALRFYVARNGAGVGPEAVRRMLRRFDGESIERVARAPRGHRAAASRRRSITRTPSPSRGTQRLPSCRPTGATCSASWRSSRATISTSRRCSWPR